MKAIFSGRYEHGVILLEDEDGPMSITNDAENVVHYALAHYPHGARILYKDTDGIWDELVHDGNDFVTFRIWNARDWRECLNPLANPSVN